MSISRRHIIQFKPEGVANIFAPTIRINGQYINTETAPSPSNSLDYEHVNYPSQGTISSDRATVTQQNQISSNFNQLFYRMFSNLLTEDGTGQTNAGPSPTSTDQSSAYGVGQNSFQSDFAQFFSTNLASQINCLNQGGQCIPSTECQPGKSLGNCSQAGTVCCEDGTIPEASNSDSSFFNTGQGYSNSVSGGQSSSQTSTQNLAGIYVDIKYNSVIFNQLSYLEKESLKNNARDRFLNQAEAEGISISTDDILQVQIFSGSVVIRLVFKNTIDLQNKIKILVGKLRSNLSVLNIYFKQNRIQTANISSSTDQLPTTSGSQTETTPDTSGSNQNNMGTGGGSTVLPSDYGVEKTFCQQFCNRELKNEKVNEEGYLVPTESYYVWRDCSTACKMNKCANCPGSNYIDPNNTERLLREKYITEEDNNTMVTNFVTGYPKEPKRDDTNKCYEKTEDECHTSNDCFYCISDEIKNKQVCTAIGANGDYICDSRYVGTCLPIYNSGANLKTYNEGPFHNQGNYTFTEKKLPQVGKKQVLEYPFQGKCIPPVKKQIGAEERRRLLYQRYRGSSN